MNFKVGDIIQCTCGCGVKGKILRHEWYGIDLYYVLDAYTIFSHTATLIKKAGFKNLPDRSACVKRNT